MIVNGEKLECFTPKMGNKAKMSAFSIALESPDSTVMQGKKIQIRNDGLIITNLN